MFDKKNSFKLKLTGRAGLIYEEEGKIMHVDSEMLVGPSFDIVIYESSIQFWDPPFEFETLNDEEKKRILKNIKSKLEPRYKVDVE